MGEQLCKQIKQTNCWIHTNDFICNIFVGLKENICYIIFLNYMWLRILVLYFCIHLDQNCNQLKVANLCSRKLPGKK